MAPLNCPVCGASIPPGTAFCGQCGTRLKTDTMTALPSTLDPTRLGDDSGVTPPPASASSSTPAASRLEPGAPFGPRYRILHRLGEGGMGVVYQAWDAELGIPVALKVIRPEVMSNDDAGRHMERRFKRELVLARQVTHKHVVRIHDLGEFGGVKYLTMPFIEGQNLAAVMTREGAMPVVRALRIARQVAQGLAAAHEVGIIHRDLKPENVMVDADDSALIMDFGLARSAEGTNLTVSGMVMGTLAYMAPEQARGEAADHRADIYAWGLMLYDMLAGRRRQGQYKDAMSELVARIQQPPPPVRSFEPRVPEGLDRIIARCIESDRERRFATTAELVAALSALDAEGHVTVPAAAVSAAAPATRAPSKPLLAIGAVVLVAAIAAGVWAFRNRPAAPIESPRETVSVLIADFENHTGDPVFDGSLEPALSLGIEGASFITAFSRRDAERAARQINSNGRLDETTARLVCQREGIRTMLAGAVTTEGNGFKVSVRAIDPIPGTVLAEAAETAADKSDVLTVVGALSARIRRALGDATPESAIAAARETFTAASLEAARDYAEAQDLANESRDQEAIAMYDRAIKADPQLGRAYAGRAQSALKLGRRAEADEYYKKAFALVDRMTEREKFRTLGTYYVSMAGNYDLAIENFEALLEKYPADGAAHNNLALAYFNRLEFAKALAQGEKLLAIYPKSSLYRYNQALYAMYAGDFPTADREARAALSGNPNLHKAYLAMAMAALASGKVDEARAAYNKAQQADARGASLASIGLADIAMYEGRFDEAAAMLPAGIEADERAKNAAGAAAKWVALSEAEHARGHTAAALTALERARTISQQPSVLVAAAQLLLTSGRAADATKIAEQLESALAPRSRAYGRLVRGMVSLDRGRHGEALQQLDEARALADLWLVRFYKGRAYFEAGAYAQALTELALCEENRRGEATSLFLDDIPTYRSIVPVSYWLGRTHEALGARDAAERYLKAYLALRSPDSDALARDAVKRLD